MFSYSFFAQSLQKLYLRNKYSNSIPWTCTIGRNVDLIDTVLDDEARIAHHASVRCSMIGKFTSVGRYAKVTHSDIGRYCAISWDVTINAIEHPIDNLTISAFPYVPKVGHFVTWREQSYKRVTIKNDVWVGANSVIMPGVTIGNGAIIGANAVVTKNIPDYAVVVGVPANIIRYRFDENTIRKLLDLKWWNLDKEIIKENIGLFQGKFSNQKLYQLEALTEHKK